MTGRVIEDLRFEDKGFVSRIVQSSNRPIVQSSCRPIVQQSCNLPIVAMGEPMVNDRLIVLLLFLFIFHRGFGFRHRRIHHDLWDLGIVQSST